MIAKNALKGGSDMFIERERERGGDGVAREGLS